MSFVSQEDRVVRHASRMAVVTLFCRVTGYLRDKALFSVIGAGELYDMYRTANRIPNAFRGLLAEGALHAAFVPTLAQLVSREDDERKDALELFRGLLAVMLLVVGLVVAAGIVASPWLVRLYASGFEAVPGKLETTIFMNRLMFPYLLLISLAALLQGVLNSHERFLLSASTPVLLNLTLAGAAWWAVPRFANAEIVLSAAVVIGGFLQFAVQAPAVRRLGYSLRPAWSGLWNPQVRSVLLLMLPGIPVLGLNQINQLISNRFASYIDSGVSYTYGAYRVTELMFGGIVVQLSTVLLPVLSRELRLEPERAARTLLGTITLVSFVTLPTAVILAVLSRPIIGVLFGGGRFNLHDVEVTGLTLTAYAFSLVGTGHVKVMASAFFAHKNTRTPDVGQPRFADRLHRGVRRDGGAVGNRRIGLGEHRCDGLLRALSDAAVREAARVPGRAPGSGCRGRGSAARGLGCRGAAPVPAAAVARGHRSHVARRGGEARLRVTSGGGGLRRPGDPARRQRAEIAGVLDQGKGRPMKMVIQRVTRAEVRVGGAVVGRIGVGLMVLVGLERDDAEPQLERAARRLSTLRVFSDAEGRMNLGLDEVGGAVLAVSQFTLAGSIRKGRRPGFDRAMPGDRAEPMFERFVELLRADGVSVETGRFGALMEVELVNDGPVTLIWEDNPAGSSEC